MENTYLEKPRWVMLPENRIAATGAEEEVELDLDDLEDEDVRENGLVDARLGEGEGDEIYLVPQEVS